MPEQTETTPLVQAARSTLAILFVTLNASFQETTKSDTGEVLAWTVSCRHLICAVATMIADAAAHEDNPRRFAKDQIGDITSRDNLRRHLSYMKLDGYLSSYDIDLDVVKHRLQSAVDALVGIPTSAGVST